jgi:hypothetical protein
MVVALNGLILYCRFSVGASQHELYLFKNKWVVLVHIETFVLSVANSWICPYFLLKLYLSIHVTVSPIDIKLLLLTNLLISVHQCDPTLKLKIKRLCVIINSYNESRTPEMSVYTLRILFNFTIVHFLKYQWHAWTNYQSCIRDYMMPGSRNSEVRIDVHC